MCTGRRRHTPGGAGVGIPSTHNSPWPGVACGPPLARPHASYTGALPGARHGLKRVQSSSEPATASRLTVRRCGSLTVAFMPLPQRSLTLGFAPPWSPPSHSLQPMVQPTENHLSPQRVDRRTFNRWFSTHGESQGRGPCRYKQVWADSQASVPFVQAHGASPYGCQT
jgi:hypothetical protein